MALVYCSRNVARSSETKYQYKPRLCPLRAPPQHTDRTFSNFSAFSRPDEMSESQRKQKIGPRYL